jgi:hypothetical protein
MISKTEASYTAKSKRVEHCGSCSMFRKPAACTLVKGEILPEGWCKHWEPRDRA